MRRTSKAAERQSHLRGISIQWITNTRRDVIETSIIAAAQDKKNYAVILVRYSLGTLRLPILSSWLELRPGSRDASGHASLRFVSNTEPFVLIYMYNSLFAHFNGCKIRNVLY